MRRPSPEATTRQADNTQTGDARTGETQTGDAQTGDAQRSGDEQPTVRSLSPSRAGDFKTCPLLYRFRCIDRIPETPSPDAVRGTVVHSVLERLFDLPAGERTVQQARTMVQEEWQRLLEFEPEVAGMFPDEAELQDWLESARGLLDGYFALEDPSRLEPAERECLVETALDDGLVLRGYVDRLDVAPGGEVRVVDYKTGGAPRAAFESKALFQMKFYALVLWRIRGQIPRLLQLIYLKDRDKLSYSPDAQELERFARTLQAIWSAIVRATESGDFRPSPGPLCGWCDHQALCPAWGGTPPPYPEGVTVARTLQTPADG